jgi:predicted lipid-binding transport protein (Tim44 family)
MARLIVIGLAIGAMALPTVMAPTDADAATCRSRKATGTVIGGLGGALVGNAVKGGGAGLLIGGVGGALVGREIGKSGCHRTRTVYYDGGSRGASASRTTPERAPPVRQVYYDHMGNPVAAGGVGGGTVQQVSNTTSGGVCRDATISYYDDRGRLSSRAVQICPR